MRFAEKGHWYKLAFQNLEKVSCPRTLLIRRDIWRQKSLQRNHLYWSIETDFRVKCDSKLSTRRSLVYGCSILLPGTPHKASRYSLAISSQEVMGNQFVRYCSHEAPCWQISWWILIPPMIIAQTDSNWLKHIQYLETQQLLLLPLPSRPFFLWAVPSLPTTPGKNIHSHTTNRSGTICLV